MHLGARRAAIAGSFLLCSLLAACSREPSPSTATSPAAARVALTQSSTLTAVLSAPAASVDELATLALGRGDVAVQYAALRRLDQLDDSRAIHAAEKLALGDDGLLRVNAVALLVRKDTPDAKAALERLKRASADVVKLVARLDRKGA